MPATWTSWSTSEEQMLRAHYPERGPSWEGWREVLPNRTRSAIAKHAKALGLRNRVPRPKVAPVERERKAPSHPYEFERAVSRRMRDGKTPSQIDREMHWPEGRAAAILAEAWRRDKEK